jgi:hypothetical protein
MGSPGRMYGRIAIRARKRGIVTTAPSGLCSRQVGNFLAKLPAMKTTTLPLVITLTLTCLGLQPKAQAVSPPPDGGYPGGNTAEGQNAFLSLTSGTYNT